MGGIAEELADEFLERLAVELEKKSKRTAIAEVEGPMSPVSEDGEVQEGGLKIPGLRLGNQPTFEGITVESCECKRKMEDGEVGEGGKRRKMGV